MIGVWICSGGRVEGSISISTGTGTGISDVRGVM